MTPPFLPLPMLGRLYDSVPQFLQPLQFRMTRTLDELTASASLVYREYAARRYVVLSSTQMKLSIYHALPTTTTCVAWHRRAGVLATATVIEDSPLGLPMDDVYKTELDLKRRHDRRLAEVGFLAVDSRLFGTGVFSMANSKKLLLVLRLLKVLADFVRSTGRIEELVACFHPKHELLFDFLGMKPLGPVKAYSGANGAPVVARCLDLAQTARETVAHPAHRFFFGRKPAARATRTLRLSPTDLRRLFVLDSSVFASASPTELAYLKSCYPSYDFGQILDGLPSALPSRNPTANSL